MQDKISLCTAITVGLKLSIKAICVSPFDPLSCNK